VATTVEQLLDRDPQISDERTDGKFVRLAPERVAVAVSHNDQKEHVRIALAQRGLAKVRVDTANKLQGLEVDVMVAWHPLAGLPSSDEFHLDPGRLCVMLTRHRHALIVVGRTTDAGLVGDVPPCGDAWMGVDEDADVAGWFAHRLVFDALEPFAVDL
jgi:hypothetical protein